MILHVHLTCDAEFRRINVKQLTEIPLHIYKININILQTVQLDNKQTMAKVTMKAIGKIRNCVINKNLFMKYQNSSSKK